jgi:hypothetical protein
MAVPVSMVSQRDAPECGANRHDDVLARSPVLVLIDERVGIGERVNVVVLDLDQIAGRSRAPSDPSEAASRSAEQQHPATPHPEVATMANEGVEDVATQDDERRPDEPLHDGVDTLVSVPQHDGRTQQDTTSAWPSAYSVANHIDRRGVSWEP